MLGDLVVVNTGFSIRRDRSPILEPDPHKRDVDIHRVEIRTGRIMKAPDLDSDQRGGNEWPAQML